LGESAVPLSILRGFDLKWLVYDAPGSLQKEYPVRFVSRGLNRFVSFEWEKKWHPEIPDAEAALPHFKQWFRRNTTE
jgi:hypothetical protein